jgi:hypothetical protein
MTIKEYERQLQVLFIFFTTLMLPEQHRIERLRDGFRQELRKGLITFQPKTVRELVEATQSLKVVIGKEQ